MTRFFDFPGRRFKIDQVHPFSKKEIKKLGITKANITTRNFRISVEALRKQFKIKDGGEIYLFFSTQMDDQPIVLVCSKV